MAYGTASAPVSRLWQAVLSLSDAERKTRRKRPATLAYDVDEVPPASLSIALALQHVLAMSVGWIYVIIAVDAMGGTGGQAQSLLRVSMIVSGLTTILQARGGRLGSGYLNPASCSLTYLAPTILAVRVGGFPLVFGMTAMNGAFTAVLSRFLRRLRILFPPDVTGLIVSIVGIQLVAIGCPKLLGRSPSHPDAYMPATFLGLITLFAMIAPSVWSKGRLRLFPILIGLAVGHVVALYMGVLTWSQIRAQWAQPLFGLPHRISGGMAFRPSLLIPFLAIGVAATLKTVGDVTLCQKMNDAEWRRTDMESVSGGVMANSIGTMTSGLLGGFAQNNASACLGVELATGVTSRALAVPAGLIVGLLAFVPGLAGTFALMPQPVMGALLIYSTCFLMLGGLQVMTARMLDARRIFAIGIALVFGISVEVAPELYRNAPELIRPIFASSTALATIIAVALSLLFRIGLKKVSRLDLQYGKDNLGAISRFMEDQGSAWGMRHDVVQRGIDAVYEFVTNAGDLQLRSPEIIVRAQFDEFHLDIEIQYDGPTIELAARMPTVEELAAGTGVALLSQYMIRESADDVRMKRAGDSSVLCLHFEH
ncbi:MAG: xanthine permease [Acidobacteria bacterium]|nr:xanthine permease [Acidobacteriota bacterium]